MTKPELSLRVDFGARRLGPGKVKLLEAISEEGSISAAARQLDMSYKRAWDLVNDLNQTFGTPVVATAAGGRAGGGASLTPMGEDIVACYRAIERDALKAAKRHLSALARHVAG
jgi:molybdate transport system regulatory protein